MLITVSDPPHLFHPSFHTPSPLAATSFLLYRLSNFWKTPSVWVPDGGSGVSWMSWSCLCPSPVAPGDAGSFLLHPISFLPSSLIASRAPNHPVDLSVSSIFLPLHWLSCQIWKFPYGTSVGFCILFSWIRRSLRAYSDMPRWGKIPWWAKYLWLWSPKYLSAQIQNAQQGPICLLPQPYSHLPWLGQRTIVHTFSHSTHHLFVS